MNQALDAAMITDLTDEKSFRSNDSNLIGRVFHESLLRSLLRKQQPEGTAFGVTNSRVLTASLNFAEHADRCAAAREAGRFFAREAVAANEQLLFIGATSTGINRDDQSQVAFTFIQDVQPMHTVTNEEQFVAGFTKSTVRLFLDELAKTGAITVVNDGDICIGKNEFDALPKEQREGFTTASNTLLMQMFIGSTYSFRYCRDRAAASAVQ